MPELMPSTWVEACDIQVILRRAATPA